MGLRNNRGWVILLYFRFIICSRLQMEAILPLGDTCREVDAHVCSEANITSALHSFDKDTVRHTAHTIVSLPHPKQWVIVHTSDLMIIIRQSIYILSIITREVGKLKTHSPTYCVMDNWYDMPYPNQTLDKIYLTGILLVQCLQISLHNDDNEMVWCTNKRIWSSSQNVSDHLHAS